MSKIQALARAAAVATTTSVELTEREIRALCRGRDLYTSTFRQALWARGYDLYALSVLLDSVSQVKAVLRLTPLGPRLRRAIDYYQQLWQRSGRVTARLPELAARALRLAARTPGITTCSVIPSTVVP